MKKVGDDAFRSGDSGTAAACYSLALKRDGQNAKLWSNRSAAFAKLGDPGRAFDDARKVRGSSAPTGTRASRHRRSRSSPSGPRPTGAAPTRSSRRTTSSAGVRAYVPNE